MLAARRARAVVVALLSTAALLAASSLSAAGGEVPPPAASVANAKVELGRRLFFDPAASRLGLRSCSDCHLPDHGWSDPDVKSRDDFGPTKRHSQTLVDVGASPNAHWDGEFPSVGALVRARITGPPRGFDEEERMRFAPALYGGVPGRIGSRGDPFTLVAPGRAPDVSPPGDVLRAEGRYAEAFEAAFPEAEPSTETIAWAISAFCHSIRSGPSAYDRYAEGDSTALSKAAQRGLDLFLGDARCSACHLVRGRHPAFTDYRFHDTGVAWDASTPGSLDRGVLEFTHETRDMRAFKTPTLRDVARRGPFMHDGSVKTLAAAVHHYLSGASGDPKADPHWPHLIATEAQVADLAAFLESLTSDTRPGAAPRAWERRVEVTRLRFVDADGFPLAGWPVTLVPAGDALPGDRAPRPVDLVTDDDGRLEFAPFAATHARILLDGGVLPLGGALVPDTCRSATVAVPVRDRTRVRVSFPAGVRAPPTLVARHHMTTLFPDGLAPRSLFRIEAPATRAEGVESARYSAAFRTDVSSAVIFDVPTASQPDYPVPRTLVRGGTTVIDMGR